MKEFWAETVTKASWGELQRLSKEIDFVLIGGWAAFLWTGKHKSKDIDLIVDHGTLSLLKQRHGLSKNDKLRKYQLKRGDVDIDIYVPFFSKLVIPPEDILQAHHTRIQGIRTIRLEALLILKQAAHLDRQGTIKGKKDEIDLVALLLYAEPDWTLYQALLEKYGKPGFARLLLETVKNIDLRDLDYLGIDFKEFKAWQKKQVSQIKEKLRLA